MNGEAATILRNLKALGAAILPMLSVGFWGTAQAATNNSDDSSGGLILLIVVVIIIAAMMNKKVRCPRCGHQDYKNSFKNGRCPNCRSVEHN